MENNFVLYRHIRSDKEQVFYIGIGTRARAESIHSRNRHWRNIAEKNSGEFIVEIMLDELSWEEACKLEKWWIAFYGRSDLGKGTLCNLTDGGEGNVNPCDEVRKKLSDSKVGDKNPQYGKERPKEWSELMSEKFSGSGNPNYGKPLPDRQKEINRQAQLGRKHSAEHVRKQTAHLNKRVINTATGKEYSSILEAATMNDIPHRTMSRWVNNNRNNFKLI